MPYLSLLLAAYLSLWLHVVRAPSTRDRSIHMLASSKKRNHFQVIMASRYRLRVLLNWVFNLLFNCPRFCQLDF